MYRVLPRPFRHGGLQWDKILMGGPMMGDINIMGEPNFDRLYHKLKVLLLLLLLLLCY